ncbi:MAG: phage baseplate assembly protein [Pseudomonadota bacterium]
MRDPLQRLVDRVLNLVGYVRLSVIDDSGEQQTAQVQVKAGAPDGIAEIVDKVPRLGEYGLYSCPPDGSEAVVLFQGGRKTQGVIIATGYRAARPKGLLPGEVMLLNAIRAQFIKLNDAGHIASQAPDWAHDGDLHATGTVFAAHVKPADGWTGTFATGDARTVTVTNGIITGVA